MKYLFVFCLSSLLIPLLSLAETSPSNDYTEDYTLPPSTPTNYTNPEGASTYSNNVQSNDSVSAGDYFPSELYYQYRGPMNVKGTNSDIAITDAYASFRLLRATTGKWSMSSSLASRWTWINTRGPDNPIDAERLYTIWLNLTGRYKYSDSSQFILGVNPQLSTDFDVSSSNNFHIGAFAMWGQALSQNFFFHVGVVYSPQYPQLAIMPIIGFSWHMPSGWTMSLKETKFDLMNSKNENFRWGPFIGWYSGSWIIKRQREAQNLRLSSLATGLSLNFAPLKNKKIRFCTDIGWTFDNTAKFYNKSGSHSIETLEMDPGFFFKISMEKEF